VIALSTTMRAKFRAEGRAESIEELPNDDLSPLFLAAIEATAEAILDSLCTARTTGVGGTTSLALRAEKAWRW
jgi:D-aminopeptidase